MEMTNFDLEKNGLLQNVARGLGLGQILCNDVI
jgi:hypothetical protein